MHESAPVTRQERFAAQLAHLVTEEADDGPDDGYSWSDGVLEARVPELNPWAGVAVLALHSHTAEEECDERCTTYTR